MVAMFPSVQDSLCAGIAYLGPPYPHASLCLSLSLKKKNHKKHKYENENIYTRLVTCTHTGRNNKAGGGHFSNEEWTLRQKVAEVVFDPSIAAQEALVQITDLFSGSSVLSTRAGANLRGSSSSNASKRVVLVEGGKKAPGTFVQSGGLAPPVLGFRELPGGPKKPEVPEGAPTWCTPEQMESIHGFKQMNESAVQLVNRRYNRGCKAIRHNYKCSMTPEYKTFLDDASLRLVPRFAAEGKCSLFGHDGKYPFPANSRILFWGNSHLRELITAIICQFPDANPEVIGSDQDNVCNPSQYKLEKDRSEIIWRATYANNVTVFGLCNCGLMYDPPNVFHNLKQMLQLHPRQLTHVVANPANVAGWAIKIKYKKCTDEPWHKVLVNRTNRELYEWNPFPQPIDLRRQLELDGFGGKIVWTLPFWCKNRSQANIYRRPAPPGLLQIGVADGFLDTSEFICPEKMYFHRCQHNSCSKSDMGQHQCLPGPPDDMASALMHILWTV